MARIRIDGQDYEVAEDQNLLQACLGLGLDLPYFCWHPAMGSVGACRQCAVTQYKDEDDTRGQLAMACMTAVSDGLILSLQDPQARDFRAGIIEALMTNHPHDCPVCEEGGECHLQDMTVMSGHHRRHYRGRKRTFVNQDLGPFVGHEMNRCITCYRCVRFYRDYAGGTDLHAQALRNHTYFGRAKDGPLQSEFAGNLVEVCPTGVFTDKPLSRHYTRKWDLQCAPSVCVHCSLGCNISPGERYGSLRRVQNRYHPQINGYFICDRGRFGFDHLNHPRRPLNPQRRHEGKLQEITAAEAQAELARLLGQSGIRWIGIGSPRATLESNRALQRLVGEEHFFSGLNDRQQTLNQQLRRLLELEGVETPSLGQIEQCDAILVLGEDLTQSAPRMALAIRQALRGAARTRAARAQVPSWQAQSVQIAGQDALHPLFITHVGPTRLDDVARGHYRAAPDAQAALGFAIAHRLCGEAPDAPGLSGDDRELAQEIAEQLRGARQPLVIVGPSSDSLSLVEAAGQIARALVRSRDEQMAPPALAPVFAECNSLGLALLTQGNREAGLEEAMAVAETGAVGAIILENDLYRRAPATAVERFLGALSQRVVIDCIPSPTLEQADLVLPATGFAESRGTLINNEGRAQALYPVYPPPGPLHSSWQWLAAAAGRLTLRGFANPAEALASCAEASPVLAPLKTMAEADHDRLGGLSLARMPHRYSGRTAMSAHLDVREPRLPRDTDSFLTFSMEGVPAPALRASGAASRLPFSWFPGWNSNQSIHKFQQQSGGNSGLRLPFAPEGAAGAWAQPPEVLKPESPALLAVIRADIFAGEELGRLSGPVFQRAGPQTLHLHPQDAAERQLQAGDRVRVRAPEGTVELSLTLDEGLARGIALLPPDAPLLGAGEGTPGGASLTVTLEGLGPDPVIATDRGRLDHG